MKELPAAADVHAGVRIASDALPVGRRKVWVDLPRPKGHVATLAIAASFGIRDAADELAGSHGRAADVVAGG